MKFLEVFANEAQVDIDGNAYTVAKMQLMSTSFKRVDGKYVWIGHNILATKVIENSECTTFLACLGALLTLCSSAQWAYQRDLCVSFARCTCSAARGAGFRASHLPLPIPFPRFLCRVPKTLLHRNRRCFANPFTSSSGASFPLTSRSFEVAFDTSFDKLKELREKMLGFCKENSRDYLHAFDVSVDDIPAQGKMVLKADIKVSPLSKFRLWFCRAWLTF